MAKFPCVRRDLSLIVDDDVTWRQLADVIEAIDQPLRGAVDYVTSYRGEPIPAGRKSVTIRLTYGSDEGTLRGEQVEEQIAQILAAAKQQLNAELRQ